MGLFRELSGLHHWHSAKAAISEKYQRYYWYINREVIMKAVLQQIHLVAQLVRTSQAGQQPMLLNAPSFGDALQRSLSRLSALQESAHVKARAFELGEPGVSLNDVMIDMQKANIAFQGAIQVRNRLVAAYQEVANMPV